MEKVLLKCDICGGDLLVGENGDYAKCEKCGAKYGIKRLQKKYQEIRGNVTIEGEVQARQTGTASDISQWKSLLKRYMDNCDYQAALPIVRKILEAAPEDEEAVSAYGTLQELKYFDIRNGVLVKYTGKSEIVTIPEGVKKIASCAFEGALLKKMCLSDSVEEIEGQVFGSRYMNDSLKEISFGNGIRIIKSFAFGRCIGVKELYLPDCIAELQINSLPPNIKRLRMPSGYMGSAECCLCCCKLENVDASPQFIESLKTIERSDFWSSPLYQEWKKEKEERMSYGRCAYCGGMFKGIIIKTCTECGRKKDYL